MAIRYLPTLCISFLLLLLAMSACDQRELKVPTNPIDVSTKDAKQVLTFTYDTTSGPDNMYYVWLLNTDHVEHPETAGDTVYVYVDTVRVHLVYHPGFWMSADDVRITGTKDIRLTVNGHQKLSSHMSAVYPANAAFPANYNYLQPLTLNWGKSGSNSYQFVHAESINPISLAPYSTFTRMVGADDGSYTFPAKCVKAYPDTSYVTSFKLAVEQVNFKIVSNIGIMVMQTEEEQYDGSESKSCNEPAKHIKTMIDIMTNR